MNKKGPKHRGKKRKERLRAAARPEPATCKTGKTRYRDKLAAKIALSSASGAGNRGNAARDEKRIYRCDLCRGWHLTSQDKRGKK